MLKRVYIFDKDIQIRAMLWKIFTPLGYKVNAYPYFSSCPKTLSTQLEYPSDPAPHNFVLTSMDDPELSKLDAIQEKIVHKGYQASHIGVMAETWTEGEIKTAKSLNYKVFQKPLSQNTLHSWINLCEKKPEKTAKNPASH